jgi:phosphoribosyl 1,2-cyclic phosphate phosphodiesterase
MAPGEADKLNVTFHTIQPLQAFHVGPYQVIPFPASHDRTLDPVLYAIRTDTRTIFYGTDTAQLSDAVWQGFHDFRLQFDLVVLDHTYGPSEPGRDHMNAVQFRAHAARLRAENLLTPNARVLATHISHPRNPPHDELSALAAKHGYEIAYDGLTV